MPYRVNNITPNQNVSQLLTLLEDPNTPKSEVNLVTSEEMSDIRGGDIYYLGGINIVTTRPYIEFLTERNPDTKLSNISIDGRYFTPMVLPKQDVW